MNEGRYTEDEWTAIAATCPGVADDNLQSKVRADLEKAAISYLQSSETTALMRDARTEREAWSKIEKLSEELALLIKGRERWVSPEWSHGPEMLASDAEARLKALDAVASIGRQANFNVASYAGYVRGNTNPDIERFYQAVFAVWTGLLKAELKVSKTALQTARGPLWRFFIAAVQPVLTENSPKSTSFPDIVDRERCRQKHARKQSVGVI